MSTLLELDNKLARRLSEFDGDPASDDPISRREMILEVADEIARRTFSFWYAQTLAMVDGTATYCAPAMIKVETAAYFDTTGNYYPLSVSTPKEMDRSGSGGNTAGSWRNANASTAPTHLLQEGAGQFRVWPTPTVPAGTTPAVLMEGYAIVSGSVQSDGTTPLFAADADEWPLMPMSEDCILPGVHIKRAIQFPKIYLASQDMVAAVNMSRALYNDILGDTQARAADYIAKTRYRSAAATGYGV
jgi:hypothetical protein